MAKIQLRNDTASNWEVANPTLLSGELGFEKDTFKYKIGDGIKNWASLPYQNNRVKYTAVEESIAITTKETDLLYLRFDKSASSGQTFTQIIPNANVAIGMIIFLEFLSSRDSTLIVKDNSNNNVINLKGGDTCIIIASETNWTRFDNPTDEFIKGISVTGSSSTLTGIKNLVIESATLDKVDNHTVSIENISKQDLSNVMAKDFDNKLKASVAFKKVAQRKPNINSDTIKDSFQAHYYEETSAVNISELDGDFLIIRYQGSQTGIIQQTLPPSSTGKTFIIDFYIPDGISLSSLEIIPPLNETINGNKRTLTYVESSFIGLFIPIAGGGGYEFISQELLHDSEFKFTDEKGNDFNSNSIKSEGDIALNNQQGNMVISRKIDEYMAVLGSDIFYNNSQDVYFDNDYIGTKKPLNSQGIIAVKLLLDGIATTSGKVTLKIVDSTNNEVLNDYESNPMQISRQYKLNEKLSFVEIIKHYNFTSDKNYKIIVEYDEIGIPEIGILEGSAICIQPFTENKKTGGAILAYQKYTGQTIKYYYEHIQNLFNIKSNLYTFEKDCTANTITELQDGLYVNAISSLHVKADSRDFEIDDSGEPLKGSINVFIDGNELQAIKGKTITIKGYVAPVINSWNYAVMSYNGFGDPDKKIITDFDSNGNPIFASNWSVIKNENQSLAYENYVDITVTVPDDSTSIAIVVYPASITNPVSLTLLELTASVEPITTFILKAKRIDEEINYITSISKFVGTAGGIGYNSQVNQIPVNPVGGATPNVSRNENGELIIATENKYIVETKNITFVSINKNQTVKCYWNLDGDKIAESENIVLVIPNTVFDLPTFEITTTKPNQVLTFIIESDGTGTLDNANITLTDTQFETDTSNKRLDTLELFNDDKFEFTANAIKNNMRIKVDCDADGDNPTIIVTNGVK